MTARHLHERGFCLNSWRGGGLLILGMVALVRGWWYWFDVDPTLPVGVQALTAEGQIPVQVFAGGWVLAGLAGVFFAFRLHDLLAIFALAFMHLLWAGAFVAGGIIWGAEEWLSAAIYLGFFGLISCWSRMVNPPRSDMRFILDDGTGVE